MPVPNPLYNPEWETVHKERSAELERLDAIIAAGYKTDASGPEFEDMLRQRDEYQTAVYDSFRMQFPTIQEHARWVFNSFRPDLVHGETMVVHIPDFETLTSHDDISNAYNDVKNAAERAYAEKKYSLPIGDIPNSNAFQRNAGDEFVTYWRTFEWGIGAKTSTLITAHHVDGKFHVCFMQDVDQPGSSAINAIERLANVTFREAVDYAKSQPTEQGRGILNALLSAAAKPSLPKPEDFHFYIHVPPSHALMGKETFMEVTMRHDSNFGFQGPEFDHKDFVPENIKDARTRVMKTIEPKDVLAITQTPQSPSGPSPK